MKVLLQFIFAASLIPAGIAVRALVLEVLWGWHVVPLGVPAISAWTAVGLAATASLFRKSAPDEDTEGKSMTYLLGKAAGATLIHPLIALFIGWVAS